MGLRIIMSCLMFLIIVGSASAGDPQHGFLYSKSHVELVSGDFNNDGHPDLAAFSSGQTYFKVFINDGNGTFGKGNIVNIGIPVYAVGGIGATVVDIDEDGDLDLLVSSSGTVDIITFLNDGKGKFTWKRK